MRALPLFKFTSRARTTSWMIALCTMFVVASFSVVAGLQNSMDVLMDNFEEEYFIVTKPGDYAPALFDDTDVLSVTPDATLGLFVFASVEPHGIETTAFSVSGDSSALDESYDVIGNETLAGQSLGLSGYFTIAAIDSRPAVVVGEFSSSVFPSNWLLCSHELMTSIVAASGAESNFAIIRTPTPAQVESLERLEFVVQPMASVLDFLEAGVDEIRTDAMWVLAPSSFVIAVLAYSFLGSEMIDKRREIGVLKMLGASKRRILGYSLGSAMLITAYGAALGLALGIVLSYAVATMASHVFTSVFVIEIRESVLVVAYLVTIAAGFAGTIIPALRSTSSSPVDDLGEVRRF